MHETFFISITVVKVGFTDEYYYVGEGDGYVRVCVELLKGSMPYRPIVLRVNTLECPADGYPADGGCVRVCEV